MTVDLKPLFMAVQYALAEMRHGPNYVGIWQFTAREGVVLRSRRGHA